MNFVFAKSLTLTLSCSLVAFNLPALAEASTIGERIQPVGTELVSAEGASEVRSAKGGGFSSWYLRQRRMIQCQ